MPSLFTKVCQLETPSLSAKSVLQAVSLGRTCHIGLLEWTPLGSVSNLLRALQRGFNYLPQNHLSQAVKNQSERVTRTASLE
jgi:hypothetical protein